MANVELLVPHVLKWEGGFVDDPDDLGGATNKGVTLKTYKAYCRRKGYLVPTVERLKNLTDEQFCDILKVMYWDVCKADRIESQSVANAIVDWAWHSGTATAVKEVQKELGVKTDGVIGNVTLAAINSHSPLPLFGKIQQARKTYLERICITRPANNKFIAGWLNRVNDLYYHDA